MTIEEARTNAAIQALPKRFDRLALAQEQANKVAIHEARRADQRAVSEGHAFMSRFYHGFTCGQEDCPVCGVTK